MLHHVDIAVGAEVKDAVYDFSGLVGYDFVCIGIPRDVSNVRHIGR